MTNNAHCDFQEVVVEMFMKTKTGLLILSPDGKVAMSNPAMEHLLGYSRKELVRPEKMFPVLFPEPAEEDKWRNVWQKDLTEENPPERVVPIIRKGGQKRWFSCRLYPLNNGGKFVHLEDITDQREIEQLKESETTFRALAEQSPNMIFINSKGRIVFANQKCEDVMGYTRQEFSAPDFDFYCLIAPEYHEMTRRNWQKHSAGKEVDSYEYVILTKHGKRITAVITTKLIPYKGSLAMLGIVTDISRLKLAEQELQALTQKLRDQKKELQHKNAALKEILAQIETEKLDLKHQIAVNTSQLILPALARLKCKVRPANRHLVDLLSTNIQNLTSKFGIELAQNPTKLSTREMEICNMIRAGQSSKEIAEALHIAIRTVTTHRNRIRRKLGLAGRGINLTSHLQAIA